MNFWNSDHRVRSDSYIFMHIIMWKWYFSKEFSDLSHIGTLIIVFEQWIKEKDCYLKKKIVFCHRHIQSSVTRRVCLHLAPAPTLPLFWPCQDTTRRQLSVPQKALTRTWLSQHIGPGFPASRKVRNKFLLLIKHRAKGTLL